jgi:hypothetical protein
LTLFEQNPVDPSDIREAARLTRVAAGTWFGGWVVTYLLAVLPMRGGGEMAMLGAVFALVLVLVVGTVSSIISLRLAFRALRLDPTGGLTKLTIGLNFASLLFALVAGGLLLPELLG